MFKSILNKVIHPIKYTIFKVEWKFKNKHNYTRVRNIFDPSKVEIGNYTYGILNIIDFKENNSGLKIGNFCSIAGGTVFLLGGEHHYNKISTYPFKSYLLDGGIESVSKGPIIIRDDVWIGYNCTILSGVTIGQGAIIAAGSTVYKNVPPYAIWGNGKVIKYRFSEEIIDRLLKMDFSLLNKENIRINHDFFSKNFDGISLKELNSYLDRFENSTN